MKAVYQTRQFKKDLKRIVKRGKEIEKLKVVIRKLVEGIELDERQRDHALTGKWAGSRDCHIEPDWILIYRVSEEDLFLERTGTHSDLFR